MGGDARRRRTPGVGEGDLILDEEAAPGEEDLRDPETELGIPPGQCHPFAVIKHGEKEALSFICLRQVDPPGR